MASAVRYNMHMSTIAFKAADLNFEVKFDFSGHQSNPKESYDLNKIDNLYVASVSLITCCKIKSSRTLLNMLQQHAAGDKGHSPLVFHSDDLSSWPIPSHLSTSVSGEIKC